MSNEDMNLNSEPCEGTEPPAGWTSPGYIARTDGMDYEFNLSTSGTVTVNGVNLGPAADLAALVRDARRFRRMEKAHEKPLRDGTLYGWCYGSGIYGWMLQNKPLAEIADALPEVEQP